MDVAALLGLVVNAVVGIVALGVFFGVLVLVFYMNEREELNKRKRKDK